MPNTVHTGVVTATILSAGKSMDKSFEFLSIDIVKDLDRVPYAVLVLLDGSVSEQKFAISDQEFFGPGKEIEIKLRYEDAPNEEATVFKGLVVKHAVEAGAQGTLLTVEMKDAAIKLTRARQSKIFADKTDADIIKGLITANSLTAGSLPATKPAHKKIVQYYCTDWDFILSRAEACGLLVMAEDGQISLHKIEVKGTPTHSFKFGIDEVYDLEIEVDANHQYAAVESIAWDAKEQKLTAAKKASAFTLSQGNLAVDSVAKTIGGSAQTLSSPVLLEPDALQAWADGSMAKSRMSLIRGRISVPGSGQIKRMDVMEIAGVGKRFNGKTIITGVHHRVDLHGWRTDVQFGLPGERFAEQKNIVDTQAAGLLPAVNGLQVGLVTALADPEKAMRVAVRLPGLGDQTETIWARMASPYAGKEHGYVFFPEIGDEVVVGFFNDDPTQLVILGAMYSAKNTPPKAAGQIEDKNVSKVIVTSKGTTIGFVDDEKSSVFIETPAKNKITFDDNNQMIQLSDQHGNTITMSKDGIEIKSAKDFKVDASGNVEIKGAKVDVK
jgi:Rhs element Vgr protein